MNKKYKKENDYSYTLGTTLTIELLKCKPGCVVCVYVSSNFKNKETLKFLEIECKNHNIEIINNDKIFNILSEKENCYVIGEFKKFDNKLLSGNHIVLVNPSNTGNLGTIIRSMLGFGFKNLAIIEPAVDIFDPKTIRASMGAIFGINFQYFNNFEEYETLFKQNNKYAFVLNGKITLQKITKVEDNYSLIFGNESSGLPEYYQKFKTIFINHSKDIDSLNLQTAVSIALYEFTRGCNE